MEDQRKNVPDGRIGQSASESIYKECKKKLLEIEILLKEEEIAEKTLNNIVSLLNEVSNLFQDLRRDVNFGHKKDVELANRILIKAKARAQFAQTKAKNKPNVYFVALGDCKEYVFQINLQLDLPGKNST